MEAEKPKTGRIDREETAMNDASLGVENDSMGDVSVCAAKFLGDANAAFA
jgi:hypothetical protein